MNEENIYKNLKQLRKERGLTLSNLADKMGSDYQQLSRVERGKSRLTVDMLMRMAEALDTPVDQLIKHTEKKPPSTIREADLGDILEKIEVALDEMQVALRPQVKAALASLIYKESAHAPNACDFALKIVKALIT
ncbi:MAG: helix-turn-helix transcriptional regulator [Verrucomicrobia bacterium]|nr:helix-turn-helix transcriptional regulator [Verrucomicrobiota bacterium]MBS0636521.1 helix-turn-helix transcriptional regulator [Verrucomicrobiota bacterium]